MMEDIKFTLDAAHRYFGIEFNNKIFALAEKEILSDIEKEEIIQTAHSAVLHWQKFSKSTMVNSQRGYYMVAKAYVTVGEKENALKYAQLCMKITNQISGDLLDFDFAYAYEIMARSFAMNNNKEEYEKYYQLTLKHERLIKNPKDLEYFSKDFKGGNWFGFNKK